MTRLSRPISRLVTIGRIQYVVTLTAETIAFRRYRRRHGVELPLLVVLENAERRSGDLAYLANALARAARLQRGGRP